MFASVGIFKLSCGKRLVRDQEHLITVVRLHSL